MSFHSVTAIGANHILHQWEYADDTAREAATGFVATDVGKVGKDLDTSALWTLIDHSPIEWQLLSSYVDAGGELDGDYPNPTIANGVIDEDNLIPRLGDISTLTDASSIAVDASLGKIYRLTSTQDCTVANPTNPTDGQVILIQHTASGADREISFTGSTYKSMLADYADPLTVTTVSGETTYFLLIYVSAATKWHILSLTDGYLV